MISRRAISSGFAAVALATVLAIGSATPHLAASQASRSALPTAPPAMKRLGPDLLKLGSMLIDTGKKEVSVTGAVTEATVLEFIAVKKGGLKAYESALELEINGLEFNLGLILIGLDPAHAVGPKFHIDPTPPQGDPVEIWVEWEDGGARRKVRAEQLVFNQQSKQTLTEGPWVYTGSAFTKDSNAFFLADLEGTLIGFVHSPAPLIDSPRPLVEGGYGENRLNPSLNLKPGTSVVLTVRALARPK